MDHRTSADAADHATPTDLPCPGWCTQPPGHYFDSEISRESRVLARYHEATLATVATSRPGGGEAKAYVDLYAKETSASNAGPILSSGDPRLVVDGELTYMTGDEARRLAAAIVAAADVWDEATK